MIKIYYVLNDIVQYIRKKACRLTVDESKRHNKERFVWREINFALGKNGVHKLSGLGQ